MNQKISENISQEKLSKLVVKLKNKISDLEDWCNRAEKILNQKAEKIAKWEINDQFKNENEI